MNNNKHHAPKLTIVGVACMLGVTTMFKSDGIDLILVAKFVAIRRGAGYKKCERINKGYTE